VANAEKQEGNKFKQSRGSRAKFDEIMNQTCQNHGFSVNHLARDCHTYKHEIIEAVKGKTKGGRPKKGKGDAIEDDEGGYPNIKGVMIIFGGPQAYEDRRHEKVIRCLIFATTPVVPVNLRWSERPITFNRDDHPDHVIEAGRFPMVVSAVVGGVKMTQVLVDRGSGINILHKDAFEKAKHRDKQTASPAFFVPWDRPRTTGYAPQHDHSVCHVL
jgi:hypothetical protein